MVWQTGQKLQGGKYEIIKVLGRGGFGITYHARHIELDTEVVIKTPDLLQKQDIEYEQYVQQFQEEAQRLAKFSAKPHPHIVKVRDYFLEDTLPCLVMDFIRGQTLMEIIKNQGRLSEAQCLIYIRQIGKALETIHQAKMVHRDTHPGNIMIQDGEAILIDFGIAKNIIPATHSITSNAANPSFAPYEQIYRGSKEREYTIDVYTLAATFYYAVTAKRPTPSMQRKLDDKSILIPPQQINGQLSEHINEAILEGMALEKEDRPQSMSAWLQLLETPQTPPSVAPEYKPRIPVASPYLMKRTNLGPLSKQENVTNTRKVPFIRLTRKLWGILIVIFVSYSLYGLTLGVTTLIPWWIKIGAGVGAVKWIKEEAIIPAIVVVLIGAIPLIGVKSVALIIGVAFALALLLSLHEPATDYEWIVWTLDGIMAVAIVWSITVFGWTPIVWPLFVVGAISTIMTIAWRVGQSMGSYVNEGLAWFAVGTWATVGAWTMVETGWGPWVLTWGAAWVVVGLGAENYARIYLFWENINRRHYFSILSGVSLSGMGLGYLIGWLIRM
ncbi:MAG: serine/threonine-protein kinase [Crocosphaera sp.]|nr:serine/threonine-protein kinase [Crocosphaera sp.]